MKSWPSSLKTWGLRSTGRMYVSNDLHAGVHVWVCWSHSDGQPPTWVPQEDLQDRQTSHFELEDRLCSGLRPLPQTRVWDYVRAQVFERFHAYFQPSKEQLPLLGNLWIHQHVLFPSSGVQTTCLGKKQEVHVRSSGPFHLIWVFQPDDTHHSA